MGISTRGVAVRRAVLGLTLASVFGCHRQGPAAITAAGVTAVSAGAQDDVLRARVDELRASVAVGGVRFDRVLARGFLAPHGQVTHAVDVAAGQCVSIVAVGSPAIRDLDAHLFDPGGDLVVEDVEVDAHPTVQLCATTARRVYHALEAFEGQGAYAVLAFASDRAGLEAVARAMGGHPGAATGAAGADGALERRLTAFRDGIARRGFHGYGDPRSVDFGGAGSMILPLQVTPDRCYTVAAFSVEESSALTLSVLDGDLDELAGDPQGGRDAAAQFCPGVEGALSVRVERRAGSGAVVLHAFNADAPSVGGEGALWLGVRRGVGDQQSVEQALASVATRLTAAQVAAPQPDAAAAPITLLPGETRARSLSVAAGRCAMVLAGGAPAVARVRVEAVEEVPARVTSGQQRGAVSAVARCAGSAALNSSARVMAERGSGAVQVRSLSFATPAWAPSAAPESTASALTMIALADAGLRLAGAPTPVQWAAGGVASQQVDRPDGRCVRVGVAAGGDEPVSLTLRDASGALLASEESTGSVAVRRCGAGAERLVVEARRGAGSSAQGLWLRWEADGAAGR